MSVENMKKQNGVQLDLISKARLNELTTMEKIRLIIDTVKERNIVILEEGLTPKEESKLIEVTMSEIDPDGFSGIEIESYPSPEPDSKGLMGKISSSIGRSSSDRSTSLTVIGPSDALETVKKDESIIQALITRD